MKFDFSKKLFYLFFLASASLLCEAENSLISSDSRGHPLFNKDQKKTEVQSQEFNHVERRRKRRRQNKAKKTIRLQYESCKDVDISSLASEKKSGSPKDTTAEFCFTCSVKGIFGFGEVKETARAIQTKAFMEKLTKRVIGQIESKIFQTKMLRACVTQNRNWFSQKKIDWPLMKELCQKRNKELKSSIKSRWEDMRVELSLTSPALREDRIIPDRTTWLDSTPSHSISGFSSLPRLTDGEKEKADRIYVNTLAKVPLENLSVSDFKKRMYGRQQLNLTNRDQSRLRQAEWALHKKSKDNYFKIMSELPVLAYLKTGSPKKKELAEAFAEIEENLKDFLKKANAPEVDKGLLLSFRPLVEELLQESREYCLVAEQARIRAEKDEGLNNWLLIGVSILAAMPCFVAGPLGASACLAGGMALGAVGYNLARDSKDDSLGRALTGKQFETMAELNEKEKELFLAKLLLPLGAWGTTAAPARAASHAITKVIGKSGSKTKLNSFLSKEKPRLLSVYSSLLRSKPLEEQNIIMEAIVGMEMKGMKKQTITEKVRKAIGQCSVK